MHSGNLALTAQGALDLKALAQRDLMALCALKLWEEPQAPDFVMEVISEDSLRNDMEYKPPLYPRPA